MDGATAPDPINAARVAQNTTVFGVILAISFCHLLNDMMQSLLPAIYPNLKAQFGLSFGQIGLVTLAYQITASLLQPLVGLYADRRPTPLALPGGTLFSLAGLTGIPSHLEQRLRQSMTGARCHARYARGFRMKYRGTHSQ